MFDFVFFLFLLRGKGRCIREDPCTCEILPFAPQPMAINGRIIYATHQLQFTFVTPLHWDRVLLISVLVPITNCNLPHATKLVTGCHQSSVSVLLAFPSSASLRHLSSLTPSSPSPSPSSSLALTCGSGSLSSFSMITVLEGLAREVRYCSSTCTVYHIDTEMATIQITNISDFIVRDERRGREGEGVSGEGNRGMSKNAR